MPVRKYKKIRKVETLDIQGKGSYIELKSFSWNELKALGFSELDLEGETIEQADFAFEIAKQALVGWNWVGDDGKPLPDPTQNGVFDALPSQEQTYIIKKMDLTLDDEKAKN